MTEKFPSPSRPRDVKQRVFGVDLARFEVDGRERAVVVTAERSEITFFWSRADASWQSLARTHDTLDLKPRRPDDTATLGWTRRIAVGGLADQVALIYKRRFDKSDPSALWIDLYTFDRAADAFRQRALPRRIPRPEGVDAFGWSVWADASDKQLHVVAQTLSADGARLVLLQTPFPISDPATFEDASRWTMTDLLAGGWDFDARRQGQQLVVLDRSTAATYAVDVALPVDPAFGPVTVPLSESGELASPTLTQMATGGMVLVSVDLGSRTVTAVDETLPFGENPQIHHIDPLIASVDRLQRGTISLAPNQIRLRRFHAERHLVMRTRRGWRATRLLTQRTNWPRSLAPFARNQQAIALQPSGSRSARLSWSALWSLRPIVLFKAEETDKGRLLTFGHQDPQLGALRTTTFRVFEDDGGDALKANAEGFALLDLGHRHIAAPLDDAEPIEHRQLRPHTVEERAAHVDGFDVARFEDSANTMNGVLVAHPDRPETFYAYTEMGDGGARVVHDAGLELPTPTAPIDEKTFRAEWVAEPPHSGRSWVRLTTPDFVPTELPGYYISPVSLNASSLVCDQQRALDGLAFACDQLRAGGPLSPEDPLTFALPLFGDGQVHYRQPPPDVGGALVDSVSLTPTSSAEVQRFIVEQSEAVPLPAVASRDDQPFEIQIRQPRSLRFATDRLQFEANVVGAANQDAFEFEWTFSDGETATGRSVEHDFEATMPDFSRTDPGQVADDVEVTLAVTAPDGRVSVATTTFPLERSLWSTLWIAYGSFRRAPDNVLDDNGDWQVTEGEWQTYLAPGMFVRDVTVSFYRYSIRYQVDEQGRGLRVDVSNRLVHDARYRFRGNDTGQGDIEYEVPVRAALTAVQLTGDFGGGLGSLIAINSVDARLRVRQRFTIGVQTSEQRDRAAESETIRHRGLLGDIDLLPSALCCLPVGEPTLEVEPNSPAVDASLTGGGWTLAVLVPAVIAAVGTAAVLAILMPIVLVIAPVIVATAGVSVMVAAIVGAGLGALAALLIQLFVLRPHIQQTIRDGLEEPSVRTSFRESGLFDFAGEGLAESLARHLIRQAQADGHTIADPAEGGRDRFRSPFFETVVVSEGECKAQVRV